MDQSVHVAFNSNMEIVCVHEGAGFRNFGGKGSLSTKGLGENSDWFLPDNTLQNRKNTIDSG